MDGPPKNMIEQTIKKRVVKQSANERAMVKTIREWNLLVVWIWSDGTNDERARVRVNVRENKSKPLRRTAFAFYTESEIASEWECADYAWVA